jgi:DNA polymerase-3 subunit epsilon
MRQRDTLQASDLTVIDLELTDLDLEGGGRVVALGAVRLGARPSDDIAREWFFNPQGRPVEAEALRIHGLSDDFLATQKTFQQSYFDLALFLGQSRLVHHCWTWKDGPASVDEHALNLEFARVARPAIPHERWVNLKNVARALSHDANSLNDMLDRYGIDRRERDKHHGAKIDAQQTASVLRAMLQDPPAQRLLRKLDIH